MNIRAAFARPDLSRPSAPEAGWVVMGSYPSSMARPTFNQSEADYESRAGLAIYSDQGQAFRNAVVHPNRLPKAEPQRQVLIRANAVHSPGPGQRTTCGARSLRALGRSIGTPDATGVVIREMHALRREPYGQRNGYQDFIGAFFARVAQVIPVVSAVRYQGQLPMSLQPKVVKPDPWNDPTRGRP